MNFRKAIAALACVATSTASLACKPSDLEHEIALRQNSAALENEQIRELVAWHTLWQARKSGATQGIGEIGIFANAVKGNSTSNVLARQRIDNVTRLIKTGDENPAPIHWAVFPLKAGSPLVTATIDQVTVVVQPACVKTNSCCPEPLKGPQR
ncbi:hypothetical protein QTH90_16765 [Variovorax sp. J2P1-59]|uniref:hypothetical protein n=1 Tax=Variovorax flavidus TaxID=3053501 RepID=UPI002575480C|nr:hypothetical protein [Variovorax sp. J2P1-59]MDM0076060.1 hypothetical protein [Variovorax sp. J2P1-59]